MGNERLTLCMVTPHLPPDQAANALLPRLLGDRLTRDGHRVSYVSFRPRSGASHQDGVVFITPPPKDAPWRRALRITQARTAVEVILKAWRVISRADVVHVHSNTFMNQVAVAVAAVAQRPFVLTHYGTEIWHRDAAPRAFDPFAWMNEHASHVTYYSKRLFEHSREVGIVPLSASIVYPPVDERFQFASAKDQNEAKTLLGLGGARVLLNVKRLHPLAGQKTLIRAFPRVLERVPGALLLIAGEGESRPELEAAIRELGLGRAVRLLGLVDNRELPRYYRAADVFVLPSLLEAFPTVAAEALACGTPVVSADHPGGLELLELFPEDVAIVPRQDPEALARGLAEALEAPRRASSSTLARIASEFRPDRAYARYLDIYRQATAARGAPIA